MNIIKYLLTSAVFITTVGVGHSSGANISQDANPTIIERGPPAISWPPSLFEDVEAITEHRPEYLFCQRMAALWSESMSVAEFAESWRRSASFMSPESLQSFRSSPEWVQSTKPDQRFKHGYHFEPNHSVDYVPGVDDSPNYNPNLLDLPFPSSGTTSPRFLVQQHHSSDTESTLFEYMIREAFADVDRSCATRIHQSFDHLDNGVGRDVSLLMPERYRVSLPPPLSMLAAFGPYNNSEDLVLRQESLENLVGEDIGYIIHGSEIYAGELTHISPESP
jgi:hypothetical protein